MKTLTLLCLSALCVLTVKAQPQTPIDLSPDAVQAERVRIQSQRDAAQALYAGQEAACYQRFAVNDCLRQVRVHRRAALEALRHQELKLNDALRKNRALERSSAAEKQPN